MAELAGGNINAAMEAAEIAMRSNTNVAVEKHNWWTAALAALACGDVARARRWADGSLEATGGMFRCLALAAMARIDLAEGDMDQAALTKASRSPRPCRDISVSPIFSSVWQRWRWPATPAVPNTLFGSSAPQMI
jgi:hypothetical protein